MVVAHILARTFLAQFIVESFKMEGCRRVVERCDNVGLIFRFDQFFEPEFSHNGSNSLIIILISEENISNAMRRRIDTRKHQPLRSTLNAAFLV